MRLVTNEKFSEEEFNKRLRFKTEPVKKVNAKMQDVALDLVAAMYKLNAIGLAANQVGFKIRLCALDPSSLAGKRMPIVMFNPEFVEHGEELYESPEACLSLPEVGIQVPRFRNVVVRFLGIDGKEHTIKDDNSLLSSVIQHEIDHLGGVLFIDRLVDRFPISYKAPNKIEE